jgi:hypothetical protein
VLYHRMRSVDLRTVDGVHDTIENPLVADRRGTNLRSP